MTPRRTLLAGLPTLLAAPAARAQDPDWPRAIAIGTASPGGAYHAYGLGLARLLTRELGIAVNIRQTSGPAENLRLLAEDAVQIAFATTGAVRYNPFKSIQSGRNSILLPYKNQPILMLVLKNRQKLMWQLNRAMK